MTNLPTPLLALADRACRGRIARLVLRAGAVLASLPALGWPGRDQGALR